MEEYELLDGGSFGIEEQVYLQSTLVNRTMQSIYSEFMGMYPPSKIEESMDLTIA